MKYYMLGGQCGRRQHTGGRRTTKRSSCNRRQGQAGGRRRTKRGSCGAHRRQGQAGGRRRTKRATSCGYVKKSRKTKRGRGHQGHPHNHRGGYAVSVERVVEK